MNNVHKLNILSQDTIDFREYAAQFKHMNDVGYADEFTAELQQHFAGRGEIQGAKLPWGATHNDVRCRPGEVTLWMGVNGHGKSELLGQACLGFIEQQEPVLIMSFEMKPVATLARMCKQAAMNSDVPPEFVAKFLDWCGDRLTVFKQTGRTDQQTLLGVIHYAAKMLNVKHIVIDSLMMVVSGNTRDRAMNEQKDFVSELCHTARNLNVHIHLVHHSRKLENENAIPGKFDAVGSGGVGDQVDQIMIVWRRKAKETKMAKIPTGNTEERKTLDRDSSDTMLICAKNRHAGIENSYRLWYEPKAGRYLPSPDRKMRPLEGL